MKSTTINAENLNRIVAAEREIFSEAWSKSAYLSSLSSGKLVSAVLENGEEIVAFGSFIHICDEGDINNIAVTEKYRKKGYGKQLMLLLLDEARRLGVTDMTLEVRASNVTAVSLYEKLGFTAEGVRKHFYFDGEDALIMWKHGIKD